MTEQYVQKKRPIGAGIFLIGLGLIILGIQNGILPDWDESWPIILIVLGLGLLIRGMVTKRPSKSHFDPNSSQNGSNSSGQGA